MKALMLNDLFALKKTLIYICVFLTVYAVIFTDLIGTEFITGFIIVMVTMMVSSAVIAEDMVKWNMYALTMPVTRRIMVKEKYFLSILFNVCGILLASLYGLVIDMLNHQFDLASYGVLITAILSVALILNSILLPVLFHFGGEKAKYIMIGIYGIPMGGLALLGSLGYLDGADQIIADYGQLLLIGLAALGIILTVVSYFVSQRIYAKKEW
jgi:ABC-2 type transport system permease protein